MRAMQYHTLHMKEQLCLSMVENTCGVNSEWGLAVDSSENILDADDNCVGVIFVYHSCIYAA